MQLYGDVNETSILVSWENDIGEWHGHNCSIHHLMLSAVPCGYITYIVVTRSHSHFSSF